MSAPRQAPARILHIAADFAPGEAAARTVAVVNHIAERAEHIFVSADPDALEAARDIARSIRHRLQPDFPRLGGVPTPGRLQRIAKAMRGYDLVLTYDRGAMDAVMAHTLFSEVHALPPLIHHEDESRPGAKPSGIGTTWYRRIAFGKSSGIVVPTERMEEIALVDWQQPLGRVKRIPYGIDTAAYGKKPSSDAIPRLLKRPGERWVGTFARFGEGENLPILIQAFSKLSDNWHLILCGEGASREEVEAVVDRLGQNHRVHLAGKVADPAIIAGLFDIYAQAHEGGAMDIARAMAAACPIVAPQRSAQAMVAERNADYLAASTALEDIETELVTLALDESLRHALGKANRARARSAFDIAKMLATYRRLYTSAMKREF